MSTGLQKKVIIQNEENKITEEEARKRFERLQYLKQNPREEEENRLAMFRANRVYEESLGSDKDRIGEMIGEFDNALNNSTRLEVELTRKKLEDLLDEIENKGFTGLIS